jgi:hypothetical protein
MIFHQYTPRVQCKKEALKTDCMHWNRRTEMMKRLMRSCISWCISAIMRRCSALKLLIRSPIPSRASAPSLCRQQQHQFSAQLPRASLYGLRIASANQFLPVFINPVLGNCSSPCNYQMTLYENNLLVPMDAMQSNNTQN